MKAQQQMLGYQNSTTNCFYRTLVDHLSILVTHSLHRLTSSCCLDLTVADVDAKKIVDKGLEEILS